MKRREFIVGLSWTAAWPLAAHAQQPAMPVVGFLRSDSPAEGLVAAFRQGLKETGFIEGQNIAIEFRWADNNPDRVPMLAAELIRRPVAVIVANSPTARVVKAVTATVPIVFALATDPVREGLVASFNRPGGNVTGIAFFSGNLGTKRLELLRQLVPKATAVGMLVNPETLDIEADRREVQAAATAIGLEPIVLEIRSERDLDPAFATLVQRGVGAAIVSGGPFMFSQRERLVALAARHALPASYALREYTVVGGLMSYGNSATDAYRQAGAYAGRILKGEKPADMPVAQATKFEFVINLKTAKTLGLEFHPQLLATADEVIE